MATYIPEAFSNQLLFVGWDFGLKGGLYLLKAFHIVREQRPNLTLLIAGPDPSQWQSGKGVEWLGPVRSQQQLGQIFRKCDLFVMPSLRDSFGFVFLEAMSQGVPCIGTNLNAMPEIIENGQTGFVVPRRDPERLAEVILRYYADFHNRYRMGSAALKRVQDHFTWKPTAQKILQGMNLLPL